MPSVNVFWPIYKNLEQETLNLSKYVLFDDNQKNVYSFSIADLIIRSAIEIEAISKELYYRLGGQREPVGQDGKKRDLYFDTDCIDLLEQKWKITQKKIMVASPTFFYENADNVQLKPLHKANKRGSSGSNWKKAYQALKHDRIHSLKMANIGNLISAMGALYILNLYYKDDVFDLDKEGNFDSRVGSDVFSAAYIKETGLNFSLEMSEKDISFQKEANRDESIFLVIYDQESFINIHRGYAEDTIESIHKFCDSTEIKAYLKQHQEKLQKPLNMNAVCLEAGGVDTLRRLLVFRHAGQAVMDAKHIARLNKNESLYPTLTIDNLSEDKKKELLVEYANLEKFRMECSS